MPSRPPANVARQVEALLAGGSAAGLPDGALLDRFRTGDGPRAERAFEALVVRHGPLVRGICRRVAGDPSDADDAFQATFLVLVRRAGSVRVDDSLGRWLAGVARRVAGRVRADRERRQRRERARDVIEREAPAADLPSAEVLQALDAEVARLAEPFRSAVVLCDLGGRTHEQAALDLGCPVGTVKSRLARGRSRLKARLTRRGFDGPLGLALVGSAGVSPRLVDSTVRLALASIGPTSRSGWFGLTGSFTLKDGVARMMFAAPTQWVAGTALTLAMAATGWTYLANPGGDQPPAATTSAPPAELSAAGHSAQGSATRPLLAPRPFVAINYRIESPDILVVEVDGESHGRPIRGERLVRPDGKISLGFYGEVPVNGLTLSEAKSRIVEHLQQFLTDEELGLADTRAGKPVAVDFAQAGHVHVDVAGFNSKVYYVQGDVGSPGRLPINGKVTVLDALKHGGGVVDTGRRVNVRLVRPAAPQSGGNESLLPVNLKAILDGTDLTTNYRIMSGDRIVVFRDPVPAGPQDRPAPPAEGRPTEAASKPETAGSRVQAPASPLNPTGQNQPRESEMVSFPPHVVEPPDILRVKGPEVIPGHPIGGDFLIQPDGMINLGYYGFVYVSGLTIEQVEIKISDYLESVMKAAKFPDRDRVLEEFKARMTEGVHQVQVDVAAYNSRVYYVLGDVRSPGRLPTTGHETVLDALLYAGGGTGDLADAQIRLVRPQHPPGVVRSFPVDWKAIVEQGDGSTNYQVFAGDRIHVVNKDRSTPGRPHPRPSDRDTKPIPGPARVDELERKLDLILQKLDGKGEKP